jgi:hypothetical protein
MFFVEYLHDCKMLLFVVFFSFWFSILLKVCPARKWLALKSCNIANSVSNLSLTYKHEKHWRTCGYFEESSV